MIGCIIQARMGSSRLPGKVLKELEEGKSILFYLLKQIRHCEFIDKIVIATTDRDEDDEISNFAESEGLEIFRGNEKNVLDRYYKCAKKFKFTTIVRITGDCPLIDPQIVDEVIKKYKENTYDYVTNCLKRTFPYGTEVEIFSFNSLENTYKNAELPSEKEHVTPYIRNHENKFRIYNIENKEDMSNYRWVVDEKNDFELVKEIVSKIKISPILMKDILLLLKSEPSLKKINMNNIPNEGYFKSLKDDNEFLKSKKTNQN